ncbi:DUF1403 family protein [Ensifer soli]|uniref:DUF1403 family protein n=1 Tax=Ciceribacter sp. sgz301302 TaxID=3342379 RepID=UPI0035B83284
MDSSDLPLLSLRSPLPGPPAWARPRAGDIGEADAAFSAGAALAALDRIVAADPAWAGCLRQRLALTAAAAAVRLIGRREEEADLRDAVLLTPAGGDPGPGGRVLRAFSLLARRRVALDGATVAGLAADLAIGRDAWLERLPVLAEAALHSARATPLAAADLVAAIQAERPEAEALAWWLADWLVAERLNWRAGVPMLMALRHGAAFRTTGGRGRLRPGEPGFSRAVCLALVEGAATTVTRANEIARRAEQLIAVAPKVRTKGGAAVVRQLLSEDAVAAGAPGADLSRWASRRMFDRLVALGGVRALSDRPTLRLYGL